MHVHTIQVWFFTIITVHIAFMLSEHLKKYTQIVVSRSRFLCLYYCNVFTTICYFCNFKCLVGYITNVLYITHMFEMQQFAVLLILTHSCKPILSTSLSLLYCSDVDYSASLVFKGEVTVTLRCGVS